MYRTAPQVIFQLVSGFSIAQCTFPIVSHALDHAPSQAQSSSFTYKDMFSKAWGKTKVYAAAQVKGLNEPRSMSEDLKSMLVSYRHLSAVVLILVVISGGAPALLGAGISIYYGDPIKGQPRYQELKRMWRGLNK